MAQAQFCSYPSSGADHPRRDLKSIHLTPGQSHIYIVDTWPGDPDHENRVFKMGQQPSTSIPKAFAQEIGASVGKAANMEVRDGKLVVEIAKPKRRRRRYTLEQLVAGIRPENRHRELEWGPPVGNEVW